MRKDQQNEPNIPMKYKRSVRVYYSANFKNNISYHIYNFVTYDRYQGINNLITDMQQTPVSKNCMAQQSQQFSNTPSVMFPPLAPAAPFSP